MSLATQKQFSKKVVSVALAIVVLGALWFFVARQRNESAVKTAIEYIVIRVVAIICYQLGVFAETEIK